MKWYETLDPPARERVFSVMRELTERAMSLDAESRRLEPPPGQIAVGAAAFDPFIHGHALSCFVDGLRKGLSPEESAVRAKGEIRFAVKLHNHKRKDRDWQRWEETRFETVDGLVRRVAKVAKEGT